MTDDATSSKGYGAVISAITSGIALIAALHPKWAWLVTLSQHAPEVTSVLPYVLGPLGVIGGAISHPPAWLRGPYEDCKQWVTATFRRKVAP